MGIFGNTDDESLVQILKYQKGGSNTTVQNFENCLIFMKICIYEGFRECWLRIRCQILKI